MTAGAGDVMGVGRAGSRLASMSAQHDVTAMAHRGFSGGGDHALENSLSAFRAAVGFGYKWVETDVHATADGVLLAFHDTTLDRTTNGHGVIAQLPWSTVRDARIAGTEPIPRLEELFEELPDTCFNIDVKATSAVQPLVDCIERCSAHERVRIASFSDARRRAVLAGLSRPVRTSPGQGRMVALWLAAHVPLVASPLVARLAHGIDAVQIPERQGRLRLLTPALLRAAHGAGLEVHVWTVNERADMERLLDLGVDGLITDRADVLKGVLLERGLWRG